MKITRYGSAAFIFLSLLVVVFLLNQHVNQRYLSLSERNYQNFSHLNMNDSLDVQILRTVFHTIYSDSSSANLEQKIRMEQGKILSDFERNYQKLNLEKFFDILWKSLRFFTYLVVTLIVIFFLAERLAIYRFAKKRGGKKSDGFILQKRFIAFKTNMTFLNGYLLFKLVMKMLAKNVLLLCLFSPAFILAYMLKSLLSTDSILFYFLLAIFTNGTLFIFLEKFRFILEQEFKKAYVETALVKELASDFDRKEFSLEYLLRFKELDRNHIFFHIYLNAKKQFISSLKELSLFIASSLMIIEMSLNIHGHLGYELLKQALYENYHIVFLIIASLFLMVKGIEIAVDFVTEKEAA